MIVGRRPDPRLGEGERREEEGEELQHERQAERRTADVRPPCRGVLDEAPDLDARHADAPPAAGVQEEHHGGRGEDEQPQRRDEGHSASAAARK